MIILKDISKEYKPSELKRRFRLFVTVLGILISLVVTSTIIFYLYFEEIKANLNFRQELIKFKLEELLKENQEFLKENQERFKKLQERFKKLQERFKKEQERFKKEQEDLTNSQFNTFLFLILSFLILSLILYILYTSSKPRKQHKNSYYLSADLKDNEKINEAFYNNYYLIRYATLFRFFIQRYGIEIKTLSEFNQPKHVKKISPSILQVFTIPKKYPKEDIIAYWKKYIGFLEEDLRKVQFDKPKKEAIYPETSGNVEQEIKGLISLINNDYHIEEVLEIAKEFRSAVQQYLLLFKEYLYTTQQENIEIDTQEYPSGVMLRIKLEGDLKVEIVKVWLNEYMALLKQNTDNLQINTSPQTQPKDVDILILKLENQIAHLKNAYKIARMENKTLQEDKEYFKDLAKAFANKNIEININQDQNNAQVSGNKNKLIQDANNSDIDA